MLRRMLTRALAVVLAGACMVGVYASPALAFSVIGPSCDPYNRIRIDYKTDAGSVVATIIWDDTSDPAEVSVIDTTPDGASTYVRIDNGTTVIQYPGQSSPYHIGYSVRKFRAVWNGYAGDWVNPHRCSP
ncbi:hypothetical protein OWR29_01705 [Actinoplanes sp. Pm04-4]|uniref:Uncharacterized protein n=1 Tax=Paractinoplanes pyxinae TaxID=2997416 RepID=A0ABT4AR35_9ACTN|nr:hypothetical protein [Actinoplanes pyxinae]MCY1136696.1 hypothetical protein [Actinoplanes pyxinae]